MNKLDELNLMRFERDIAVCNDKIEMFEKTKDFYEEMLDETPGLGYVLIKWMKELQRKIDEEHIQIQYLNQEKKIFLKKINE